jgi:23S rRNA pseudouridine1911/1915/1917 synthase
VEVKMEWVIESDEARTRLDKFLAHKERLGSRPRATTAIERGKVFVNGDEMSVGDRGRPLAAGDRVRVWMDRPGTAHRRSRHARRGDLPILYEDDTLLVVNKPAGLLTVPLPVRGDEPSVEDALVEHLRPRGKRRPLVVHRIDRDTSGLVIFATRGDAQARLKEQFKRHEAERIYLAVVHGHPEPESGTWRDRVAWNARALKQIQTDAADPRGRDARSDYRVLETFASASLLEVRLFTGKRNQIRLQAQLRGHPLVGEQLYREDSDRARPIVFPRQALHAYRLSLRHPVDGRFLRFEAPLPADLAKLIQRLRQG